MSDSASPRQLMSQGRTFGPRTIREVDINGLVTAAARPVPCCGLMTADTPDGFVQYDTDTGGRNGGMNVLDHQTLAPTRHLPGTITQIVDDIGVLVPDGCDALCPLTVIQLSTGRVTSVLPPPDRQWAQAVLAPNGKVIAALAVPRPDPRVRLPVTSGGGGPPEPGVAYTDGIVADARLVVVDTTTGKTEHATGTMTTTVDGNLAWSPDSDAIMVANSATQVTMYDATNPDMPLGQLPVSDARSFLVVPRPVP
jgi:hypothetical protein